MKTFLLFAFVILMFTGCPASAPYRSNAQSVDGAGVTVVTYGTFENYDVIGVTFKNAHEFIILKERMTGQLAGSTTEYVVSTGKTTYTVPLSTIVISRKEP